MNRDVMPTGVDVALATGELMVTARRAVAVLEPGADPAAAVAAVRAAVGQLWPRVMPEAARDVMLAAAELALEHGVTELPADVDDQTAQWMLEMTAEWLASGKSEAWRIDRTASMPPPLAFASSVTFDRDEDDETLTSLSVLLALSHLALRERAAAAELADAERCPDCGRASCTGEGCYWPDEAGITRPEPEPTP